MGIRPSRVPPRRRGAFSLAAGLVLAAAPAAAEEPTAAPAIATAAPNAGEAPAVERPATVPLDAKVEAPIVAYAYAARGTSVGRVGAQAYGVTLMGKGQKSTLG